MYALLVFLSDRVDKKHQLVPKVDNEFVILLQNMQTPNQLAVVIEKNKYYVLLKLS